MFGCGIYFATDSSKSAQKTYTKDTNKLLLCDVALGKAKRVDKADPTLNLAKIRQEGFDSVFAPRGTHNTGGVINDEFVIFDPDQAMPRYIIFYSVTPFQGMATKPLSALTDQAFNVKTMQATRHVDLNDPFKPHYDNAFTMFYKVTTTEATTFFRLIISSCCFACPVQMLLFLVVRLPLYLVSRTLKH
jgi:Poly(ADP-ribose) polymerase catalytic domain